MSEFKYACPVCGQHIKCDSSQAGTQMECPTCFQKITVPQAPATEEQKFILTGTKVGNERPIPKVPEGTAPISGKKAFPSILLVLVILIAAGATGVFLVHEKNSTGASPDGGAGASVAATNARVKAPPVAPPATDADWTLDVLAMTNFPTTPVVGRIHGKDFIIERAIFQNGTLTLREGHSGPVTFGIQINFGGAQAESLSGQSLDIATNAPLAARITLRWPDGNSSAMEEIQSGYAMRLKFETASRERLPGEIYFCAPDDSKSYLLGSFRAAVRRPKPTQ